MILLLYVGNVQLGFYSMFWRRWRPIATGTYKDDNLLKAAGEAVRKQLETSR